MVFYYVTIVLKTNIVYLDLFLNPENVFLKFI